MIDIAIIGAGPAGLSAALYVLRSGFSAAIIGSDTSSLNKAEKIENYFGLERPVSGRELLEIGRKQVMDLGGTIMDEEVVGISWEEDFTVDTNLSSIPARAVIIATGTSRNRANIKNLTQLEGKGVSYCAVCDAFFYRGKNIAVLGSGEYALHEASELLPIADHITLLTNGEELTAVFPEEITVVTTPVRELTGQNRLERIVFSDSSELAVSGLFVALGTAGGNDLAKKLGLPLDNNKIVVNSDFATALPGVFAAGDCVGGVLQVSTAVGEGATAALSAIRFLRNKK